MSDTKGQPQQSNVNDGRRHFCRLAIGGMAVVSAGTVAYPVLTFLKLPKSVRPKETVEIPLAELSADAAKWADYMGQRVAILIVDGKPLAFNGACTHLGCIVHWDASTHTFRCPCHGAVFSATGDPIDGPVNTPLKRIALTVQGGVLKIG